MDVYVALISEPSSALASFKSVHMTLEDAIDALYPGQENRKHQFETRDGITWNGPDGFGMVRRAELQEPQYYIQLRIMPPKRGREHAEEVMGLIVAELDSAFGGIVMVDKEVYS